MKAIQSIFGIALLSLLTLTSCSSDDNTIIIDNTPDFSGTFAQEDQMGRPAVNTVFVSSGSKDAFNTTIPSQQNSAFHSIGFEHELSGLLGK